MGDQPPVNPAPVMNDEERQRLEARFQRQREQRLAAAAAQRRTRRLRLLWGAVAVLGTVGGLAGVFYVSAHLTPPPGPPLPVGPLAPAISGPVHVPRGMQPMTGARLAPLAGLGEGCQLAQETQVLTATVGKLPLALVNSIGMEFRLVPPGTGLIGSPPTEANRGADEREHTVSLGKAFYLATYEVTQGEWEALFGPGHNPSANASSGPRAPVDNVTWDRATEFCAQLCVREHLPPRTYRLPTEAEWEYAARAGTQGPYFFAGDASRLSEYAIYLDNSPGYARPVGTRRPNAWGFYDQLGNVWEWCDNHYYDYGKATVDPVLRSLRGGNFRQKADECRLATRFRLAPDSYAYLLGFRVLRVLTNDTVVTLPAPVPPATTAGPGQ